MRVLSWLLAGALIATGLLACVSPAKPSRHPTPDPAPQPAVPSGSPAATPSHPAEPNLPAPPSPPPPAWVVGAQPLPLRPDGFGVVLPTPAVLSTRILPTTDQLAAPTSRSFESTISAVPPDVLARSTWEPSCPVHVSELRYLTMSFHGFDGQLHTGEMLVHADVAETVVAVFEHLFAARFPIEEMRVVDAPELDLAPTGDGNNTSAFVCRPARGLGRWSAHAYGLAVDLNPFQNPYHRTDLVLPELASAYLVRDWVRPGMVFDGGPAVTAFESTGWTWGGRWSTPRDTMHFSATGN